MDNERTLEAGELNGVGYRDVLHTKMAVIFLGVGTGFTKSRVGIFLIFYIILSDDREGKLIEKIDLHYFSDRASFIGNPVGYDC